MGAMPEESRADSAAQSGERSKAHPPLPRDKRGWHVSPAPDGRGMPDHAPSGPPAHRRPGFLWFVLILLVINWGSYFVFQPSTGEQRVTVPFSAALRVVRQSPKPCSMRWPIKSRRRSGRWRPSCADA